MSKELVIASNRHETKLAILEDDQVVELYFQRANEYSLAGSIHKGRVTRVLPGMQSAFVDLGLERDTFLYVSDFAEDHHDEELDKVIDDGHPHEAPRQIEGRSEQPAQERSGNDRAASDRPREERGREERSARDDRGGRDERGGRDDRGGRRDRRGRRDDRRRRDDRPPIRTSGRTEDGEFAVDTVEPNLADAPLLAAPDYEGDAAPLTTEEGASAPLVLEGERLSGGRYRNRAAGASSASAEPGTQDGTEASAEGDAEEVASGAGFAEEGSERFGSRADRGEGGDRAAGSDRGAGSGRGAGNDREVGNDRGDRNGRRGRRRRGRGGNFPEAKYASNLREEGEGGEEAAQPEEGNGRREGRPAYGRRAGGANSAAARQEVTAAELSSDLADALSPELNLPEASTPVETSFDAAADTASADAQAPQEEAGPTNEAPIEPVASAEPEIILLPGESLAKYRNRGAGESAAPASAPEARVEGERSDRGDRGMGGRDRGGRDRDRGGRGGRDRDRGGRGGRDRDRGGRGGRDRGRDGGSRMARSEASAPADSGPRREGGPREVLEGEVLSNYRAPEVELPEASATAEIAENVASASPVTAAPMAQELPTIPEPPPFVEHPVSHHVEPPAVIHEVSHHTEVDGESVPYATVPASLDPAEIEEADAIEEAREELLTETDEELDEIDEAQAAAEAAIAAEQRGEIDSALLDRADLDEVDLPGSDLDAEFDDAKEAGDDLEPSLTVEDGEEGPEPARQPQSLTATLRERERGGRFGRDRGRRGRRRRGPRERVSDLDRPMEEDKPLAAEPVEEDAVDAEALSTDLPGEERAARGREERGRDDRGRDDRGREERSRDDRGRDDRGRGDRRGGRRERGGFHRERPPLPQITDLLKAGQEILVQIAKEPIGQKGARITSHIALPGRYCVYMPTVDHNGVSRKIASDQERLRLKRILQAHRQGMPGGFIIRTAGEGCTEEEIAADMHFLHNLWVDIRTKSEKRPAPALIHHDLDIVQRTLRDQLTEDFKAIWLDNEELYESTVNFIERFQPNLVGKVKLWTRPVPIFDAFNISTELEKALRSKVWLKSGGYIVINQTEALVAVDVNTGKFVGKSNRLEDTIVKTNIEAVKEIVRQIRLRDLGGIIVVDFIDMDERKNRQKVMQALEEAMRVDRAPYKILQFNDFGLVAITRKRVKQSLERSLCMPCVYCDGAGYVKSVPTVISEILHDAAKLARGVDDKEVMLRVHPEVAKALKSSKNQYLEELESIFKRPVLVTGDPTVHIEKYVLA